MLRRRRTVLACALAGLLLGISGCTIPTTDSGGGYGPSGQKAGRALKQPDQPPPVVLKSGVPGTLKARDSRWWPGRYVVDSGASVILRISNSDSTQHNFTLEGEGISKNLPSGDELELKFSAPSPGRHRFYCKYQREEMQGWITVQ
jgi:Cupredoxin-like domain